MLQRRVEDLAWEAPDESVRVRALGDGGATAVLRLPPQLLEFTPDLGYWIHLKPFPELVALLILKFELSDGPGEWAVPGPYSPRGPMETLIHDLKFDEGWENSTPAMLVSIPLTPTWRSALEIVVDTGELALTVVGGETVFPVRLQESQLEELSTAMHM